MVFPSTHHPYNDFVNNYFVCEETISHPSIDLQLYKTEIISLYQNNNSTSFIATSLKKKYDLEVTDHTIKSRLQQWGIRK
jgi:hypothetical protein